AAVRSQEQAQSLSQLGIHVLQVDLGDIEAVTGHVLQNNIDIIIHTATSIDSQVALNLITALQKRRETSKKKTYLVHTTGLSAFDENTGWPFGEVKDTDRVFDLEQQSKDSYIVRQVDVFVTEQAKAAGVTSLIVAPPTLYGRGSGTWNKLSPQIPGLVRASITHQKAHKFAQNREVVLTHISDLTGFYARLVEAILREEIIPVGEEGYYFIVSNSISWWDIVDRLAVALHARGMVAEPIATVWPSDEMAADALGVPVKFAHSMWNSGPKVICDNKDKVGWQPMWDNGRFLASLDDEITDYLELGRPKSSLLDSLQAK
ncbi:hypothetical protein BO78DRAFT_321520, partial [Aspergillus sclerotiicarbonarius CBS 121057]